MGYIVKLKDGSYDHVKDTESAVIDEAGHLKLRNGQHTVAAYPPGWWMLVRESGAVEPITDSDSIY